MSVTKHLFSATKLYDPASFQQIASVAHVECGEREFMAALFPGYVGELASSAMIKRSVDDAIERRESCWSEPIEKYLTTDHVLVEDDYSDTQLAELFLHHRVLVIPIATEGRVHAVVTRADFFRALAERFADRRA